jgi:hypothetical protein
MPCPWLKKENGKHYCTAVTPKKELDFTKPPEPNINGDICKLPAPALSPTEPWNKCKLYHSK